MAKTQAGTVFDGQYIIPWAMTPGYDPTRRPRVKLKFRLGLMFNAIGCKERVRKRGNRCATKKPMSERKVYSKSKVCGGDGGGCRRLDRNRYTVESYP